MLLIEASPVRCPVMSILNAGQQPDPQLEKLEKLGLIFATPSAPGRGECTESTVRPTTTARPRLRGPRLCNCAKVPTALE